MSEFSSTSIAILFCEGQTVCELKHNTSIKHLSFSYNLVYIFHLNKNYKEIILTLQKLKISITCSK